jgi:MFS family permease
VVDRPFRPLSLDLLNLLLIDVNGAIKPYLNVYLFVHRGWSDAAVGLVGTASGLVSIAAQIPTGVAIDAARDKCMILLGALVALSVATLLVVVAPHFWPVLAASCALAAVRGVSPDVQASAVRRRLPAIQGSELVNDRSLVLRPPPAACTFP